MIDPVGKHTADMTQEEKRVLLAQLLKKKAGLSKSIHPLSYNQRAMWFLHQLAPNSSAYNTAFSARIRSRVEVPALRRAFQALIDRHASLRTIFVREASEPRQEVNDYQEIRFQEVDASKWTEEELKKEVVAAHERPFNLKRGPLLRVNLFTRSETEHVLLLSVHHIAFDGWSKWLLLDELRTLYAAEAAGRSASLPKLNFQYSDFVRWQTDILSSPEGEKLLSYWQKQLSGGLTTLDLSKDRPRPPVQTYAGGSKTFTLDEALIRQIKELARAEGATLFVLLLGAFQILLYRYTNQENFLVGTAVTGRSRAEFEGVVGDFMNMVAVRADLRNDPPFKTFLAQVRQVVLDAVAHQDYPFPLLVEKLAPDRDPTRSPVYQVSFLLQKPQRFEELVNLIVAGGDVCKIDFGGLTMEPYVLNQQEGQLDLTFNIYELKKTLLGSLSYNTDLFSAETITRLLGHFKTLLQGIVANPEQRISNLALLTDAERHQLLLEWNDTNEVYRKNKCVHELIEAQVDNTPERTALRVGAMALSYAELDTRAARLAQALRSRGVGRGQHVGLCVERGADMVAAMLGILKAGAAYVPLDPALPPERLRFMADDAQLALLVTTTELGGCFALPRERQLLLDADAKTIDRAPNIRLPVDAHSAQPEDPAYVIYTSGSTGKPKGVVVPHRGVVNFLSSMAREPGLNADDVLVAVTTLSFDIAALELHLPLTVGATVVIASRGEVIDGRALSSLLEQYGATVMQATPVTWRLLTEAGWKGRKDFKALVGSEALPKDLADQLIALGVELWNMYGPTETTVWSTCARITDTSSGITIGRPIANTTVYVLDQRRQLCPIGVPGELCIGGDGVALGYWNRPELTAERFIPAPFSTTPGARFYLTGDRARWRNDGTLEHLGRLDFQVKIRGFRIELGEIEAVLRLHSAVREAVVIADEDVAEKHHGANKRKSKTCPEPNRSIENLKSDKRLVAYVVPQQEGPSPHELRTFLKRQLPDYMVPSAFVLLDALPLTPSRKLDRQALPKPEKKYLEVDRSFVRPRDALELQLTNIWEEILDVKPIGVRDNFFELGGHSLLAVRLFAQIEKMFGKTLPLASLFQGPTVEQLVRIIRQEGWSAPRSSLVAIQPCGSQPPFFCVHAAGGGVPFYADLVRYLGSDQPFYGLHSLGLDGERDPLTQIEAMADHYIDEILTIQPKGPYLLGGLCMGGIVAFEVAQQLQARGQKVALLALLDCWRPVPVSLLRYHLQRSWQALEFHVVGRLVYHERNLLRLSPEEKLTYIVEKARIAKARIAHRLSLGNGTQASPQALYRTKVREANIRAMRSYEPKSYLGRIALFLAGESPLRSSQDRRLGWRELADGGVEVHVVPGDHRTMVTEPHARILAKELSACIDRALSTASR